MVFLLFISRENCENNKQDGQNGIQSLLRSVGVYSLTAVGTTSDLRLAISRGTCARCRSAVTKAVSLPGQCGELEETKLALVNLHPVKTPSTPQHKIESPNYDY